MSPEKFVDFLVHQKIVVGFNGEMSFVKLFIFSVDSRFSFHDIKTISLFSKFRDNLKDHPDEVGDLRKRL